MMKLYQTAALFKRHLPSDPVAPCKDSVRISLWFLDRIYRINRIRGTVDTVFVFVYGHGRPDNLVAKFINTHNLVNPVNPV